ncbi:MAG: hypothetical protein ACRDTU_12100 [Micromonosporaceae bacterium]
MTDPTKRRAPFTSHRADSSDRPTQLFSPAVRRSGEDASDGPVDGWVDDVDSDWDDIIVPDRIPPERSPGGQPAPESGTTPATEPISWESLANHAGHG